MPDFAPNVTPRYKAHYVVATHPHSIQFRVARGTNDGDGILAGRTHANALFAAFAAILFEDFHWVSAEYAHQDSDLFFPATLPTAVTGLTLLTAMSPADEIMHLTFSGRGAGGSKVSVHVYGTNFTLDLTPQGVFSDWILTGAENAGVASALTSLAANGDLRAIDNTAVTWRQQATIKLNDYWLRQLRKGG